MNTGYALASSTSPLAYGVDIDDEEAARIAAEKENVRAINAHAEMKAVVANLEQMARDRVQRKLPKEQQAIRDLEQYWGRYDEDTQKKLNEGNKSKLFINYTRQKTDAMTARLQDLLFPTDDKNWGISPTPVPTLTEDASASAAAADALALQASEAAKEAVADGDPARMQQVSELEQRRDQAQQKADQLARQVDEGRKRAKLMEYEIEDQLTESNYNAVCRDVLEDACKLGTGIAKGPVTGSVVRKGWKSQQDGTYKLVKSDGTSQPAMRHVNWWSYFPDMDARSPTEGEGDLERHLLNRKGLLDLADLPGFDKEAIKRLAKNRDGRESAPAYMADLRNLTASAVTFSQSNIAGGTTGSTINGKFYHVWEYTGPLDEEDVARLANAIEDPLKRQQMYDDIDGCDPLERLNCIVWFCEGEVLKFALYPYESGESMYSVFNLVKDETSMFGYGIPFLISDPQAAINAACRALMDNAGLATGPQIVIDSKAVEPVDGVFEIVPRKLWEAKDGIKKDTRPFEAFDIPMHGQELEAIIGMFKATTDDMSGMPALAQGEQGAGVTKTAQGMALLMNSSNVVFRRYVKNFDDDFTAPNIRRWYDWNMQFSKKEEIKGDYTTDARGSSVLLAREMQATNLTAIIDRFGMHPVYGPMLKAAPLLRKLFQAMMIPTEEVVYTDDEIQTAQAAQAKQEPEEDPEKAADRQVKVELANQAADRAEKLAQQQWAHEERIAAMHRDTELIKMATVANISLDKAANDLQKVQLQMGQKDREIATEVAIEAKNAAEAHARGEEPTGSGGFISAGSKPASGEAAG